jgi:aromatic-L-amino-acid decarboxylase
MDVSEVMSNESEGPRVGSTAEHQHAVLPALANREKVLADVERVIAGAWASFDRPRISEPHLTPDLIERLRSPLPDAPGDADEALADAARVLDASVSPCRPLYVAYIGSSGLEVGVLASVLAATYDANLAASAGGADLLDEQALRWVAEFVGFPLGEGAFTSGGMTSNLTALLAARERAVPGTRVNGLDGRRATVYCSEEAHFSVVRAVEACGIGSRWIRRIDVDRSRRLDPRVLDAALVRDVNDGVTAVAVVATAGTTLTGAVDPLDAVADVCARHGVWLHVDGAYGLPAAAADSTAALFTGFDRADSATIDAHKWFGVQKPCSVVLLREAGHLQAAFGHEERYMLHEGDIANPVDRTLEYSRPLNSLRLWMAFRIHGADQFRRWIEQTLANARTLTSLIRDDAEFELLHEPQLSTVCFREPCNSTGGSSSRPPSSTTPRVFECALSTSAQPTTKCR